MITTLSIVLYAMLTARFTRRAAALSVIAASCLLGQIGKPAAKEPEPDATPTIKVDVDQVNLFFSVRNKQNGLVPTLTKDDFSVAEDGKPQTVNYFAKETDLPLTIGLLVDVSRSQENLIDTEKRAASQFFTAVLRQKDMAFLISFGSDAELLQDSTNSAKLLRAGLEGLRVNSAVGGFHPGPVPTVSQPRGTILFDSVYLAANDKLRSEVGRKAVVVITDGVDQGSRVKIQEAIEAAQKADAIIYSIEYADPVFQFYTGGGGGALKRMAEETGGRAFRVDRKHTLDEIFKELQDEMRTQYVIGYTPTNNKRDGGFRRIELKTPQKELKVQVRRGYYATNAERP